MMAASPRSIFTTMQLTEPLLTNAVIENTRPHRRFQMSHETLVYLLLEWKNKSARSKFWKTRRSAGEYRERR